MNKILILDVGGVIILSRRREVFEKWAIRLGKNIEVLHDVIKEYNSILAIGSSLSIAEYLKNKHIDWIDEAMFENLRKDLWSSEYVNQKLILYLLEHADKYTYALLTNNFKEAERVLDNRFKIPKFYKYLINSSDVGTTKPDMRIYKYALTMLKTTPQNCIFVDDKSENVNAAITIGMYGIIYTDFETFKKALELFR